MKNLITAAGLAALGITALHGAALESPDRSKPWSVSATLRGFYDDNYATAPKDFKRDSFGFEFSPEVGFNMRYDQTSIKFNYKYGVKYYEDRNDDPFDQSHEVNAFLRHQFNQRYKVELNESFVIAQEPEILENNGVVTVPLRTEGDNMRNYVSLDFYAQLTEVLGLVLGYSNTFYDYDQEGIGSRSALLDRLQHMATLNLRWQMNPRTVGIFGYQFGVVNYISDDDIVFGVPSNIRDNRSHYVYLGADHQFNPQLNGSVRVGAQFTDYYNAGDDTISPYADASLTYLYSAGSHFQIGVRHARNQTDIGFVAGSDTTLDQESTTIYMNLNHQITAKLVGNLMGQFQDSSFQGGPFDGSTDDYFMAGANLTYHFNKNWSGELGYNYDRLDSDLRFRSFTRNRVYLGVKFVY